MIAKFVCFNLPIQTFNMITDTLHKMLSGHQPLLWNELIDWEKEKYEMMTEIKLNIASMKAQE